MLKHDYKSFRNRLNNKIRCAEKDYYHELFEKTKNVVKQTLVANKKVFNYKSNEKNLNINSILLNNLFYSDPSDYLKRLMVTLPLWQIEFVRHCLFQVRL